MIERPDPDALLAGPLGQWLASQQGAREEAKATAQARRRKGFIAAFGIFVVMSLLARDLEAGFWFGGFVALLAWAWGEMAKTAVTKSIKGGINGALAEALGLTYAMEPDTGEEWTRARQFGLGPGYDRASFEDGWSGEVGALPFRVYEAHCEVEYEDDDKKKWRTVFRGVVLSVGFTRRFHGTTLVERDGARKKWFGGEKEEIKLGGVTLGRCDMVDQTFEARFTVWGDDPVEARFLVHPEYVERLTAVEQAFAGSNLRCLFCGGQLLILIDSRDLFESGSIDAGKDRELLVKTIDQFATLADLAKRLNEAPRGNFTPAV